MRCEERGSGIPHRARPGQRRTCIPVRGDPSRTPTAPHPVLPHHLLPAVAGRREGWRCRKNASCTSGKTHAGPFSPLRRGEGAAAAADEGRFHSSSATADDAPLVQCCNVDWTPPPTAPHPVLPHHLLPAARGEGKAGVYVNVQGFILGRLALSQECKAAFWKMRMLVPSPRCDGEKVRRQPRIRGALCFRLCFRARRSSQESTTAS